MTERPNIWLVVLDGYPGRLTLEADYGIADDEQLAVRLEHLGFESPRSAWSSYPTTDLSIPSILEMAYPAQSWTDNDATLQALYNRISGDNALVGLLEANGYETVMVEAGWSGSSCRSFDLCIPPPLYDDAANLMVHGSILGDREYATPGYGFAVGTQSTMRWLLDNAGGIGHEGVPFFVFSHLLAPHPPLFLNDACKRVVEPSRRGLFYPYPGVSAVDRDRLFIEQLACVDSFVLELTRLIGEDDIVVLVADHGTGRRAQMGTSPGDWSSEAIRERMNVFLSVKAPNRCSIGDTVILPNVMRRIISCLSDEELDDVESRMFIGPQTEVNMSLVKELLALSSPAG